MRIILPIVAVILTLPALSAAETIIITRGTFDGTGGVGGLGTTTIASDDHDFTLTATGAYLSNAYAASDCDNWTACDTISPSGVFSGGDIRGDGTFDGEPFYLRSGDADAYLKYSGPSAPFARPTQGGERVTVEIPFTFTGYLWPTSRASAYTLLGEGTATLVLSTRPQTDPTVVNWYLASARYTFVNPLTVPEPASLLLLSTGLLACWRKQIRDAA